MRNIIIMASAALLAGCGEAGPAANEAAANTAAATAEKPRAAYCFFKEPETKGWAATRDASGNIVVTGKAFRSDPRYKAILGEAKISGNSAEIAPSIVINDTGFAAPENWWDVKAAIPGSEAVETVTVNCGARTLATLSVRRAK